MQFSFVTVVSKHFCSGDNLWNVYVYSHSVKFSFKKWILLSTRSCPKSRSSGLWRRVILW
jgi:hypothetical protein